MLDIRLGVKLFNAIAIISAFIAILNVNSTCIYTMYQPNLPKELLKYRNSNLRITPDNDLDV